MQSHEPESESLFSLRVRDEGGEPASHVRIVRFRSSSAEPGRLLLCVHGFNVDAEEARDSYGRLRRDQRARAGGPFVPTRFERGQCDLFWPGDADWPGAVDVADGLVYPRAVGVAKELAPRLATFLDGLHAIHTIDFLAHSLGCRLVLETIGKLRRLRVGRVCLAAAAVPAYMLQPGGALHAAALRIESLRVLFSRDDEVLALAFPPGQTLAGRGEGFMPVALGRSGELHPSVGGKSVPMTGADHGDYWGHDPRPEVSEEKQTRAARLKCGREVHAFLGAGRSDTRQVSERPAMSSRLLGGRSVAPVRSRR